MTPIGSQPSPSWESPSSAEYASRPRGCGTKRFTTMIHRTPFYLLCLLSLGGHWFATASAETNNSPTARERLNRFLQEVHTLTANFQQTIFDEQGQSMEDSSGVAHLSRPKRFHWAYREPYPQTIVADGERVWFYDEELSQVIVKRWNSFSPDATPAALLTTVDHLEKFFTIEDLGPGKRAGETQAEQQWVKLTPKSSEATFVGIKLGFGEESIRIMELIDSFGQTTRLTFREITVNPKLDPKLFSFTPPKGVDVVEGPNTEDTKPR
uniref:Outer-membrane lipoprotein carrier protein n=1 Tax=Candidatus Kentrum sp. SD TaxID=2126332 RepID=A0A450YC71_9GAMM|nr:MAG: outer membrane lipoprotein carrier protein [Candidatus Kentron sp. SD]VFK44640.1 MAG: outer membrane lipoprotein carrier protein [Candidatus Kentron sp. SD]